MDEITVLAAIASFLLGAGITRLVVKPESPVLVGPLETVPEVVSWVTTADTNAVNVEHEHEASHATPGGWFCDCGKHRHVYVFGSEEVKRCQCGAEGIGKEWAID